MENCACILHNLTYQLEAEYPECFRKFQPKTDGQLGSKKSPTIGCFSPKSSKAQKEVGINHHTSTTVCWLNYDGSLTPTHPTTSHLFLMLSSQFSFDVTRGMPEDSAPSGVNWLCHPTAMQTYLSLLGLSKKDATLEASCGALQNLTASKGLVSTKKIIVRLTICVCYSRIISLILEKSNRDIVGLMTQHHHSQGELTGFVRGGGVLGVFRGHWRKKEEDTMRESGGM